MNNVSTLPTPQEGHCITNAIDSSKVSLFFALALHWLLPYFVCPCMGCAALVCPHGLHYTWTVMVEQAIQAVLWCVMFLDEIAGEQLS